jgi:hypothetical protein
MRPRGIEHRLYPLKRWQLLQKPVPILGWILLLAYLLDEQTASAGSAEGNGADTDRIEIEFADSFVRNLPLLVPFAGPLIESLQVVTGSRRLGDRMTGR